MSETTINMTQPPPPPAAPRLLRRSSTDRIFGGVCGGLGRYWNVDPVVLRVVFGVSLLLGGFGLFAYLAMWLLVPDESAPPTARVSQSWGLRILGAGTAFIAAMIGLGLLFSDSIGGGGVLLGALLAGVVVWIVMSQRGGGSPAATPAAPAEPVGYAYGGDGGYTATTALPAPPVPPAPPRERSYLGLIGLFAAVAASGVAILLGGGATVVMAAALLALGVTMLVGGFYGRAKWLLVFAIPLLMLLAVVSQVERADLSAGQRVWEPTTAGETYSLTLGTVDVDFAQWQGAPVAGDEVTIDMGVGEVRVAAPRNWDVELVTTLDRADVRVDGERARGRTVAGEQVVTIPASSGTADGTLRLNVDMQAGEVIVRTGAPAVGEPTPEASEKTTEKDKKEKAA
ncbi:MAG: PspC domain-containing protein [Actinobacteria bacterium]|nr:PspC domain-containing protein [Actinomycetota bacterium]